MSEPLTSFERAARLFIQAEKLGCDTPTESMIADVIQDAEFDTLHNPEIIAERHGAQQSKPKLLRATLIEQRDAWKAAFDEVEGQRNSLVTTVGELRQTLEAIKTAFIVLHDKWLTAGHRRDMNDAMDSLALALGASSSLSISFSCDCGGEPHGKACKAVLTGAIEYQAAVELPIPTTVAEIQDRFKR